MIFFKSSGISMGLNGGTSAPPVLPTGIFPTKDFTPPTSNRGICPKISRQFLILIPKRSMIQWTSVCSIAQGCPMIWARSKCRQAFCKSFVLRYWLYWVNSFKYADLNPSGIDQYNFMAISIIFECVSATISLRHSVIQNNH
jgi:hypothetical protein